MRYLVILFIMGLTSITLCSAQEYIELAQGSDENYFTIEYRILKENVEFRYYYPGYGGERYVTVYVDVNKNGMIDSMLDRRYAYTGSGLNLELCSQYLIEGTRTTSCGGAPSKATVRGSLLAVDGTTNFKTFSIPKKELAASSSDGIIHVRIEVSNNIGTAAYVILERTKYPECTSDLNCTGLFDKVYEIKIK